MTINQDYSEKVLDTQQEKRNYLQLLNNVDKSVVGCRLSLVGSKFCSTGTVPVPGTYRYATRGVSTAQCTRTVKYSNLNVQVHDTVLVPPTVGYR